MKFKVNKIAAAVAVGLGTAVAGMSTAQADEVLFPYVVASATVTTLVSSINNAVTYSGVAPTSLHYKYWYKNGTKAEDNSAECSEVNKPLPSSANDVVTFDVGGKFKKDNLNILFEDVKTSTLPKGDGKGYGSADFGLLGGVAAPVRAFLIVDNNDTVGTRDSMDETLTGEAMILEFVNGAAWGYTAYNPAGRQNPSTKKRFNINDFSDYVETTGEVIASESGEGRVPVAIPPRFTANKDDVISKFLVTPIAPTRYSPYDNTWVEPGGAYRYVGTGGTVQSVTLPTQLRGDLTATVALGALDAELGAVVMYDRDEGPISGQVPQTVKCVGAVDVRTMMSEGALSQLPKGGWSNLIVATYLKDPVSKLPPATTATDEAIVIKIDYNTATSPSLDTTGIVNNAIWLRKGIRESVPTPVDLTKPRIQLFSDGVEINSPSSLSL